MDEMTRDQVLEVLHMVLGYADEDMAGLVTADAGKISPEAGELVAQLLAIHRVNGTGLAA